MIGRFSFLDFFSSTLPPILQGSGFHGGLEDGSLVSQWGFAAGNYFQSLAQMSPAPKVS